MWWTVIVLENELQKVVFFSVFFEWWQRDDPKCEVLCRTECNGQRAQEVVNVGYFAVCSFVANEQAAGPMDDMSLCERSWGLSFYARSIWWHSHCIVLRGQFKKITQIKMRWQQCHWYFTQFVWFRTDKSKRPDLLSTRWIAVLKPKTTLKTTAIKRFTLFLMRSIERWPLTGDH